MKLSMRTSLSILNFLIIGAIFVPPDFSSSVSHLTINWLVRLFVAVGFFLASLRLSHAVKSGQAERLEVIERFVPDADLDFNEEAEEALELPPTRKSWSSLWSPRSLILIAYCLALLSAVFHAAVFCKVIFILVVVFLWMPNPWQSSADQPEIYRLASRHNLR